MYFNVCNHFDPLERQETRGKWTHYCCVMTILLTTAHSRQLLLSVRLNKCKVYDGGRILESCGDDCFWSSLTAGANYRIIVRLLRSFLQEDYLEALFRPTVS
jgi:hypothetical protein